MTTVTERLQANGEAFRRGVPATPSVVGMLRDVSETHLHKWGLGDLVEVAELVVSELVTNAVNHNRGRLIGLEVVRLPAVLMIDVWDPSPYLPTRRYPEQTDCHGRGLAIVEALTQAWGVCEHPAETGGKTVWACISLPSRSTSTSQGGPGT